MTNSVTITLPPEVFKEVKKKINSGLNFSKFCSQSFKSAFMDDLVLIDRHNKLIRELKELEKQILSRKNQRIKELEAHNKLIKNNPKLEILEFRFLVSTKRRTKKDIKFLDPNYKRYCNIFNFITKEAFIQKLDQIDLDKSHDIPDYEEDGTNRVETITRAITRQRSHI